MDGRAFLDTADRLAKGKTEADWRTAAGRAYYALFLEARSALERWGFTITINNPHFTVQQRFDRPADPNLRRIGATLIRLAALRKKADYEPAQHHPFSSAKLAIDAIADARMSISLLDAIDADPVRRAAAVAAVRKAFP